MSRVDVTVRRFTGARALGMSSISESHRPSRLLMSNQAPYVKPSKRKNRDLVSRPKLEAVWNAGAGLQPAMQVAYLQS